MSGPLKCELEKWLHSTLKIPVLQGGEDVNASECRGHDMTRCH